MLLKDDLIVELNFIRGSGRDLLEELRKHLACTFRGTATVIGFYDRYAVALYAVTGSSRAAGSHLSAKCRIISSLHRHLEDYDYNNDEQKHSSPHNCNVSSAGGCCIPLRRFRRPWDLDAVPKSASP